MKKVLVPLTFLFSLVLSSCGSAKTYNYEVDDSVSNQDGSMAYEIFVRSFYDSNNDGIGDLKGVESKLPYLNTLGIKTIWLLPIHPASTYHGYDVTDYYDVHPDYGTLEDFDSLVAKAKEYNMDIMIDMVLNHTSKSHPWFKQSYEDFVNNNTASDSKKDYYNWIDSNRNGYHKYNDYYYEGQFNSSMPDLNLDADVVRNEIDNICKFWIEEHGVKGFRLDAVKYYYGQGDITKNNEFLSWLEETTHKYDSSFYMVGEAWYSANTSINEYYNSTCDSFFKFTSSAEGYGDDSLILMAKGFVNANKFGNAIEASEADIKKKNPNGYYSYFLTNHDMDRASTYLWDEISAKMGASLLALMPGTPYMYYGEEIYLKGQRNTSPDDGSDVRRRLPMIWSETDKTGECKFPETNRPDLMNNEQVKEGVYDLEKENLSLLNHYKKVINMRNKYPFMKHGIFENMTYTLNTDLTHVLAYKVSLNDEGIYVIHNFDEEKAVVSTEKMGSQILDYISVSGIKPVLKNNQLTIGSYSTVIISLN